MQDVFTISSWRFLGACGDGARVDVEMSGEGEEAKNLSTLVKTPSSNVVGVNIATRRFSKLVIALRMIVESVSVGDR